MDFYSIVLRDFRRFTGGFGGWCVVFMETCGYCVFM